MPKFWPVRTNPGVYKKMRNLYLIDYLLVEYLFGLDGLASVGAGSSS